MIVIQGLAPSGGSGSRRAMGRLPNKTAEGAAFFFKKLRPPSSQLAGQLSYPAQEWLKINWSESISWRSHDLYLGQEAGL
jgi:hypothetical protein